MRMIALERKRTERSAKPFLLMLLETGDHNSEERSRQLLTKVISTLVDATRETDVIGWHKDNLVCGSAVHATRVSGSEVDIERHAG